MMGEMAAELTGLSVLKDLMWSRDVVSNSCEGREKTQLSEINRSFTKQDFKTKQGPGISFLAIIMVVLPWQSCLWRQ